MIFKLKKNLQSGMSYVELIVVLGIFAVLSAVVVFNYSKFQTQLDIKTLASEIALKVTQAQKSALAGTFSDHSTGAVSWKPAYGVYINAVGNPQGVDSKNFFYFLDRNNDSNFNDTSCVTTNLNGECLDKVTITKNNYISSIDKCGDTNCSSPVNSVGPVAITFTRPNSGALFSFPGQSIIVSSSDYVQITISSPAAQSDAVKIKVYPTGRIQVN